MQRNIYNLLNLQIPKTKSGFILPLEQFSVSKVINYPLRLVLLDATISSPFYPFWLVFFLAQYIMTITMFHIDCLFAVLKFCFILIEFSYVTHMYTSFFDILASTYGPGPYGPGPLGPNDPGPLIILKNILSSNAPGPYLKIILLQEHVANMLLEQCAFQIWPWSIFDSDNSFRLWMVQDLKVLMVQNHMVEAKITKKAD